eukprot:g18203.t1
MGQTEAAKADRHAKLQKWTRERSKKSKGKSKDSQIEVTPPGLYRHSCDLCGAEVDLAVNLAGQGLTFKCAIMGRACSGPKSAPVMAPAVPVTPVASAPGAGAVMAVDADPGAWSNALDDALNSSLGGSTPGPPGMLRTGGRNVRMSWEELRVR